MSFKKNVIFNYAGQIYLTLLGILILPVYVNYLGVEAFGLVSFFAVMQTWFNLLDMGLTPTVARETARFHGGAMPAQDYRQLMGALEVLFWIMATVGGGAMFLLSGQIATVWLNVQHMPLPDVTKAVELMTGSIALRWISGLYRGCITGAERLAWLNGFSAAVATLRIFGVLLVFSWFGSNVEVFFTWQLVMAAIELVGLSRKARTLHPPPVAGVRRGWHLRETIDVTRGVLQFSLGMFFLSLVWVLITQTDKLVLSTLLPLNAYGQYSMGVLIASGVLLASSPVSSALIPRMSALHAQGDDQRLFSLYRQSTQAVVAIVLPVSWVACAFPHQLLWMMTGDSQLAQETAPVLVLYVVGNAALALAAFPYYLQFAKGDLKLHVISNLVFLLVFVPILVLATRQYGAVGAGASWCGLNLVSLVLYTPMVHSRFGAHHLCGWLVNDICRPFFLPFVALLGLATSLHLSDIWSVTSRLTLAIQLALTGSVAMTLCLWQVPALRAATKSVLKHATQKL